MEEKELRGEVAIISNACETHMEKDNREDINDLMDDGHEVGDDRITYPKNKLSPTEDNYRPIYKEVW